MTFWEGAWAFVRWWGATLIIALAVWPITFQCLKRLPDRGFAFARMFGLIGVGYFFWLGCWLHLWPNLPGAVWLCAALLLAVGMLLAQRRGEKPWAILREHWREALFTEGLFLALFALWTWVRANNPQGDWAEKPMEIAFINSIMRSPYFPPNDPWLSGYAISYYHFGYIMTGMLAKISALTGNVAFNLAVAASFGMVGVGSWGILRNLLILRARAKKAAEPEAPEAGPETSVEESRVLRRSALPGPRPAGAFLPAVSRQFRRVRGYPVLPRGGVGERAGAGLEMDGSE